MPLMASHTVLVMTSAEKLGPGRSRTPPPPSLVARVYRRRAARGEPGSPPLFATVRGAPLYSLRRSGARPCVPAYPERRSRRSSRATTSPSTVRTCLLYTSDAADDLLC